MGQMLNLPPSAKGEARGGETVNQPELQDMVDKGLEALSHGHTYLAMTCLEEVIQFERTPVIISQLAYCRAANGKELDDAIALATEALDHEPSNPLFCLNLGRIYLLAGRREDAIAIFRQGLTTVRDQTLIAALESLGTRKPPVFPSLHRNHPLNRFFGKLLHRLGWR